MAEQYEHKIVKSSGRHATMLTGKHRKAKSEALDKKKGSDCAKCRSGEDHGKHSK